MTEKHKHEEKPWRPNVEREPELNPFVNPLDRSGQLENPPPLADEDEEGEDESVTSRAPIKPSKP